MSSPLIAFWLLTAIPMTAAPTSLMAYSQSMPSAQGESPGADADKYFAARDWTNAALAYGELTAREPLNSRAWYRLAYSMHALDRFDEAVAAYEKSIQLDPQPIAMYNLACAHARLGHAQEALDWLSRSVQAGFARHDAMKADLDLESLRADPRFAEVVKAAERRGRSCLSPKAREFDFWIGEWDVENPRGQKVGTNVIQSAENGCVILENWTGALGGTGRSLNFYDASLGRWRQIWVDSSGNVSEFDGNHHDGAMRLQGQTRRTEGTIVLRRLTFFNLGPDRVRQLSEQSIDGGTSWTVSYDFLYKRKR